MCVDRRDGPVRSGGAGWRIGIPRRPIAVASDDAGVNVRGARMSTDQPGVDVEQLRAWNKCAERLRRLALAEAGYPMAKVLVDDDLGPGVCESVLVDGQWDVLVPPEVIDRAMRLVGLRA